MKNKTLVMVLGVLLVMLITSLGEARNQKKKSSDDVEETAQTIYGEPMIIRSSAYYNWRASCREWEHKADGGKIMAVDCGDPKCEIEDDEFICVSSATKTIKYPRSKEILEQSK
jgi:hypothetical protein